MTLITGEPATAATKVPANNGKLLVDDSKSLTAETEHQVEADLESYSNRTGNQVAVLLVKTTNGESIENYTHDVFNSWAVGQKGKDNGVLMVLAMNDHHGFVETGFGLESTLTDVQTQNILNTQVFPRLKANDPNEAVRSGEVAIRAALGDPQANTPAATQTTTTSTSGSSSIGGIFVVIIIVLAVISAFGRRRGWGGFGGGGLGGFGTGMLYGSMGGWGGGRGFGGGFGGGGGGGGSSWGGFGGGHSGGGGAGGSW